MSTSKNKRLSGFGIDENGKSIILPNRKFLNPSDEKKPSLEKKAFSSRGKKPLEPLRISNSDFDEPYNKRRKVDNKNPVRKELFQKPPPFITRSGSAKKTVRQLSVLGACPFKSPSTPHTERKLICSTTKQRTPLSHTSNDEEFRDLERQCENATNNLQSPLLSVCSLLENTKIQSIKKPERKNTSTMPEDEIRSSINRIRDLLYRTVTEMSHRFEEINENLNNLENNIKHQEVDKKKNCSANDLSPSNFVSNGNVMTVSPVLDQRYDLRKSTLKNNLAKTVHMTPKTEGAIKLYNRLRVDTSSLATPTILKHNINSPKSDLRQNLSLKIQNQCLMLQDTPMKK